MVMTQAGWDGWGGGGGGRDDAEGKSGGVGVKPGGGREGI